MMPQNTKLLYEDITDHIWPVLRELHTEFRQRRGYSEHEMRNALAQALQKRGLAVATEVPVIHRQNGQRIGVGFMDIVIECRVVIEVKNVPHITSKHMDQLHRYVEDSGLAVGILINFGCLDADLRSPEGRKKIFYRYYHPANDPFR